jgi:hypothetical protein
VCILLGREAQVVRSEEHQREAQSDPSSACCPASAKSATAQPEVCGQASNKRVGTKIADVFGLNDLGDDQEPEVLPPGRRSDRLFFEELFFAVD